MAKHYLKLSKTLLKLLYDKRMNPAQLAKAVNLPTPTVHRLVSGKSTRPYRSSLEPIADYFSLEVEQLLGESPIEETKAAAKNDVRTIPILTWKESINLSKIGEQDIKNPQIVLTNEFSEQSFALIMPDTSMEPLFPRGSTLIFDPMVQPKDRSYILVKLSDTQMPAFRQLLVDMDQKYLKPLNPDFSLFKMRMMHENDEILGLLVESRNQYLPDDQKEFLKGF